MPGFCFSNSALIASRSLRWSGAAENVKYVIVPVAPASVPPALFSPPQAARRVAAATAPAATARRRRRVVMGFSFARGWGWAWSGLDAGKGDAADDVPLGDDVEREDRQDRQRRAGHHHVPLGAVTPLQQRQPDGEGHV